MNALIRNGTLRYVRSLEATCDVTIICQHNVKLMAHKIVLGIGSALLQDILLDCRTCHNMTILLPQVPSELISLVLDFVYTGSISLRTESDYKDFLEVAKMLKLHNIDTSERDITKINNQPAKNSCEELKNILKDETTMEIGTLSKRAHAHRPNKVRNKVLPSPWKSRSPKHSPDWSYGEYRSRFDTMNDDNNNDVAAAEQQQQLLPRNVSEKVSTCQPLDNDANATRPNHDDDNLTTYSNAPTSGNGESKMTDDGGFLGGDSRTKSARKTRVGRIDESAGTSKKYDSTNKRADDKRLKVYTCKDCDKTFTQLRNYKYHRSIHEGSAEFAADCLVCGKTFHDKGYLRSHMKIHRDMKEYACDLCPKRFNQRVAYNMHARIHTGVKPHKCATCGKSFSRKMLLKQHERVHTGEKPFVCPQCGKTFADRSNMMLHARLHTGEKPYTCSICEKRFTKKHHLKTHINCHTGVKPYSCKSCGLTFSQSSNMKTHFKRCGGNGANSHNK